TKEVVYLTITERIFGTLAQKKLSQKEFAKRIEINEKTVSAWKKNNSLPPVDKISKISDCLGVSIDYLLTGKENQTKELSDDKQRLLKMYDLLTPMEKGEILGELKAMTKNRTPRPDIQISERAIARSKGNPFREAPTPEQIASFTPVPEDSDL
ncbi:MAG: helix-turn-helix domain-containing protein, partial [Ruminococcus sp.]|nr:helix-turn-helix domain-containing protein [Ruminococcus sp.]